MSSNKPKKAPKGDYAVGYARPPKATKFQPGQSGNSTGRPRGRMRKLFDMALQGKVQAIQLVIARLAQAQAALNAKADPEAPLTEEEIALLAMMMPKTAGG